MTQRILAAVRELAFVEDVTPTRITVSAGVATYSAESTIDSMDALVRAADQALYRAQVVPYQGQACGSWFTRSAPPVANPSVPGPQLALIPLIT